VFEIGLVMERWKDPELFYARVDAFMVGHLFLVLLIEDPLKNSITRILYQQSNALRVREFLWIHRAQSYIFHGTCNKISKTGMMKFMREIILVHGAMLVSEAIHAVDGKRAI
jgi:hypothetical protein